MSRTTGNMSYIGAVIALLAGVGTSLQTSLHYREEARLYQREAVRDELLINPRYDAYRQAINDSHIRCWQEHGKKTLDERLSEEPQLRLLKGQFDAEVENLLKQ